MSESSSIAWLHAPSGPDPMPPRDGDKVQARQRINVLVRTGRMPHPNTLACVDCGHTWTKGERRHEYDHHLGYAAEHHYDVEPVCTLCHAKRDNAQMRKTHCANGHERSPENIGLAASGNRFCILCRKEWGTNQHRGRDAEFWRKYRAKRKAEGTWRR